MINASAISSGASNNLSSPSVAGPEPAISEFSLPSEMGSLLKRFDTEVLSPFREADRRITVKRKAVEDSHAEKVQSAAVKRRKQVSAPQEELQAAERHHNRVCQAAADLDTKILTQFSLAESGCAKYRIRLTAPGEIIGDNHNNEKNFEPYANSPFEHAKKLIISSAT